MTEITLTVETGDSAAVDQAIEVLQRLAGQTTKAPAKTSKPAAKKAAAKKAEPKAEPEAEPEVPEGDGLTLDDVREALKGYAALEGKPKAIQILTDHGADSISELDAAHFADVIKAAS